MAVHLRLVVNNDAHPWAPAGLHEFPEPQPRYVLRASLDGYVIEDRGEVIATFRGPSIDRAAALLRRLNAEEAGDDTPTPPNAA
jgi:hypothetical protein